MPETKKDIPIQGDKPRPIVVGALSPGKEVFQAEGSFSCD